MPNTKLFTALLLLLGMTIFVSPAKAFTADPIQNSGLPEDVILRMLEIQGDNLKEPINCWGVALWSLGMVNELRPSFSSEILFSMEKNKCRKLGLKEEPAAGDIGSFYNSDLGIYHSFIYLGDSWGFEKGSPYRTETPITVDFRVNANVIENYRSGCKIKNDNSCELGIVNYRCSLPVAKDVRETSEFEVLLNSMQNCNGSPSCKEKLNKDLLTYTTLLMSHFNNLEEFKQVVFFATSKLTMLFQSNSNFRNSLNLESLNAFLAVGEELGKIEASTPKSFEGFLDYQ